MLGDFVFVEEDEDSPGPEGKPAADPQTGNRKTEGEPQEVPRRLENAFKRFFMLAFPLVIGGLLLWFFVIPTVVPAAVHVSGFPGFDGAAVIRAAGLGTGATYLSVNARKVQELLAEHPLVESVKVTKSFPDRISIFLEPRVAVAVGLLRVSGRMQPVYFDRYGVAFMVGQGLADSPPTWLPVVSGLYRDAIFLSVGSRLPDPILPLFRRIGEITDSDPEIWQAISEIAVRWNENDSFDLALFPIGGGTRLLFGGNITAKDIYYALLMLDVETRQGGRAPEEIDLRSGIGVLGRGGAGS
ncbi:MAG: FtsQ-type POTRA domain-containing protein [Treponema sp.]|nr:FtsQ-type POTRA domain-containing protein [Treponema sp.]